VAQLYPRALGSSGTSGVPFPVPTIVGPWGELTSLQLPWLYSLRTDHKENTSTEHTAKKTQFFYCCVLVRCHVTFFFCWLFWPVRLTACTSQYIWIYIYICGLLYLWHQFCGYTMEELWPQNRRRNALRISARLVNETIKEHINKE
jgi:hypothetical protein